ncbi:MAG: hypothetical protein NUV77_03830 [Thermoguttaceae bacterium]|jgi:hypothetical protein|nr:hypothetical protein [Thermoguttaceae bacterium]
MGLSRSGVRQEDLIVQPTKELADELFREEVLRARAMRPEDKLLAGARLFDLACRVTKDGIRHAYPDADEVRVREILQQRLALARRLEETS